MLFALEEVVERSTLVLLDCITIEHGELNRNRKEMHSGHRSVCQKLRFMLTAFCWIASISLAWSLCNEARDFGANKARKVARKLDSFARNPHTKFLVLDGSNLRGTSKYGWDHVELQSRIHAYCYSQGIDLSVLVWDHGSCPFAIATSDHSLVLFSGLSQRTDDVIVKEIETLTSLDENICLAVVTNDVGLTNRIRKKFDQMSLCWRDDRDIEHQYLTLDSTRFVDILHTQDINITNNEREVQNCLQEAKDSIAAVKVKLRNPLASRREKTWERVVLAETLRRQLADFHGSSNMESEVISAYMHNLSDRGFKLTPSAVALTGRFPGPSRLDKQQRRALDRFNKLILP